MKQVLSAAATAQRTPQNQSQRRFTKLAWCTLGYMIIVILWGAFVRATGSGAGCGEHWPLCNGSIIQRAPRIETLIELSHRLTSGFSLILVLALVWMAFRHFPKTHALRQGAALSLFFLLVEAGLGAGLVLLRLVENNASVMRAVAVALHLINTFILLACLTYTAWWAQTGKTERLRWRATRPTMISILVSLFLYLCVGASGAIVALGDTLFPSASLAEGFKQDFAETAHFLIRLRAVHPLVAIVTAVLLLLLGAYLRRQQFSDAHGSLIHKLSLLVTSLVLLQLALGFTNMFLLAPVWLQLTHLLFADLTWIALCLLALESINDRAVGSAREE